MEDEDEVVISHARNDPIAAMKQIQSVIDLDAVLGYSLSSDGDSEEEVKEAMAPLPQRPLAAAETGIPDLLRDMDAILTPTSQPRRSRTGVCSMARAADAATQEAPASRQIVGSGKAQRLKDEFAMLDTLGPSFHTATDMKTPPRSIKRVKLEPIVAEETQVFSDSVEEASSESIEHISVSDGSSCIDIESVHSDVSLSSTEQTGRVEEPAWTTGLGFDVSKRSTREDQRKNSTMLAKLYGYLRSMGSLQLHSWIAVLLRSRLIAPQLFVATAALIHPSSALVTLLFKSPFAVKNGTRVEFVGQRLGQLLVLHQIIDAGSDLPLLRAWERKLEEHVQTQEWVMCPRSTWVPFDSVQKTQDVQAVQPDGHVNEWRVHVLDRRVQRWWTKAPTITIIGITQDGFPIEIQGELGTVLSTRGSILQCTTPERLHVPDREKTVEARRREVMFLEGIGVKRSQHPMQRFRLVSCTSIDDSSESFVPQTLYDRISISGKVTQVDAQQGWFSLSSMVVHVDFDMAETVVFSLLHKTIALDRIHVDRRPIVPLYIWDRYTTCTSPMSQK